MTKSYKRNSTNCQVKDLVGKLCGEGGQGLTFYFCDIKKSEALLITVQFSSAFTNCVKPVKQNGPSDKGKESKMLVVADGGLIKNHVRNGRPLELGYDKWTNNYYATKNF